MAKLVVRRLRCWKTTSGAGNDQVYMVVFRGSFTTPSDMNVVGGKGTPWGNVGDGKVVDQDMVLDDHYQVGNAYVVVLLEQDDNKDILTSGNTAPGMEFWSNHWLTFSSSNQLELCARTALILGGGIDDDDVIGIKVVPKIHAEHGTGALLEFEGDGGHYGARVVMRP